MESTYLRTLIEVIKAGSISKAAETLCVTQPAVSRRIRLLEEQYGYPLLDRSGQTIRPTEAGYFVFEKAEKLLAIEKELLIGLKIFHPRKSFSFCCTHTFGLCHFPAILKKITFLSDDITDLAFHFDSPESVISGLSDGLYDMAVIEHCESLDLSDFTCHPLPEDTLVFISSPALDIPSPEVSLEALLSQTLFCRKKGFCSRKLLDSNLKEASRDVRHFKKLIVLDDLQLIAGSILNGEGIAFVSQDLVAPLLRDERLKAHRVSGFNHSRKRTAIHQKDAELSSHFEHFAEIVRCHFGIHSPQPA